MSLSERERIVLKFLDIGRMEANARQIGEELSSHKLCGGGYVAVGSGVAAAMRRKGLLMRLPDLNAWRITRAGREAISQSGYGG